jgi:hypothetical protein
LSATSAQTQGIRKPARDELHDGRDRRTDRGDRRVGGDGLRGRRRELDDARLQLDGEDRAPDELDAGIKRA